MPKPISFQTTRDELDVIVKIAERADREIFSPNNIRQSRMDTVMDLSACHANGCPLKLAELLEADGFNFAHDVAGIRRHINRETGTLEDCFVPRYAVKQGRPEDDEAREHDEETGRNHG